MSIYATPTASIRGNVPAVTNAIINARNDLERRQPQSDNQSSFASPLNFQLFDSRAAMALELVGKLHRVSIPRSFAPSTLNRSTASAPFLPCRPAPSPEQCSPISATGLELARANACQVQRVCCESNNAIETRGGV
ncbi:uncharacterized protein BXZ73DRAFT_106227 [Epithele typhae]|uniref:uncharacterized protein n=1 Tax=Epithele typhae TaxID=378194 RepID=UPI002007F364|nr:uncharacterized protein BXZ73DRAFT_106227 [Epithele typhae]KAH9915254.1 hypothetical protein BXZ73DRAFT_106227 [Epithele typhae]